MKNQTLNSPLYYAVCFFFLFLLIKTAIVITSAIAATIKLIPKGKDKFDIF